MSAEGASTLPFRDDPVVDALLRSPNDDRLRLLPGDCDWVVRFVHPRQYAAVPDLVIRTRAAHAELERSGVRLPPRAYLEVEERPGSGRTALIVAARITGEGLAGAAAESHAARVAAEQALTSALAYYASAFVSHSPYLGDVHLGQFMWGTHRLHGVPEAWMVDLDPGSGALPPDPTHLQIALLHSRIGDLTNGAIELESRTGQQMEQFRAALDELTRGPVFAHSSAAGRVDRMREALSAGAPLQPREEWAHPLMD